jgi:Retroviral aspartyl protease
MESIDMEIRKKDLPHPKVKQDTNTLFTTGLIPEISVAIIISSESDVKSILLNKVLIDTGCTRTIIKQNKLPDKFFESRKQLKEVS